MINSDISEIFGTLIIGLVSLFILLYCYYYITLHKRIKSFLNWLKEVSSVKFGFLWGAVFALLLFGFGLIMQDLTDKLTDSENKMDKDFYFIKLKSEKYHRAKSFSYKNDTGLYKLSGLAGSVFSHPDYLYYELKRSGYDSLDVFVRNPKKYFKQFQAKTDTLIITELEKIVNPLYYRAKNWSSGHSIYSKELEFIQRRIDFARSLFLLMIVLFYVSSLSFLYVLIFRRKKNWFILHLVQSIITISLSVLLSFVSNLAYGFAENNYNERAFGYYVSHLDEKKAAEKKPEIRPNQNAVLWMQYAEEYKALCLQTYNTAWEVLKPYSSNNYAIVMDLDETVLDNSAYQAALVKNNAEFKPKTWDKFVKYGSKNPGVITFVPGAKDFITKVEKNGFTIVYISNRSDDLRKETVKTLSMLGLNTKGMDDSDSPNLLLQTNTSSKAVRRKNATTNYNIMAYIGDNLADLADIFEKRDLIEKNKVFNNNDIIQNFGVEWFVIPNPSYGSWHKKIDNKGFYYLDTRGFTLD